MDWNNLPWDKIFVLLTVLVSGPGVIIGIVVPAIGQMVVASMGLKAIARQPEAGDRINDSAEITLESVSPREPKEAQLAQRVPQLDQKGSKKRNRGQLLVTFCPFLGSLSCSLSFFLPNQVAM